MIEEFTLEVNIGRKKAGKQVSIIEKLFELAEIDPKSTKMREMKCRMIKSKTWMIRIARILFKTIILA